MGVDHIFLRASGGVQSAAGAPQEEQRAASRGKRARAGRRGLATLSLEGAPPPAVDAGGVAGSVRGVNVHPQSFRPCEWPSTFSVSDHRPITVDLELVYSTMGAT